MHVLILLVVVFVHPHPPQSKHTSLEHEQFLEKVKARTSRGSVRPHLIDPQVILVEPEAGRGNGEREHLILGQVDRRVLNVEIGLRDASGGEDAAGGGEVFALAALGPGRRRKRKRRRGSRTIVHETDRNTHTHTHTHCGTF